jgi:hypothetical protein
MTSIVPVNFVKTGMGNEIAEIRPMAVRPSPSRIVRVVAGLDEWTDGEKAWIAEHPELLDYQRRLREAMDRVKESSQTRAKRCRREACCC